MIHALTPIAHKLDKVHEFISHLMSQVWCAGGPWDESRLYSDFVGLVKALDAEPNRTKKVMPRLKHLHDLFSALSEPQRRWLRIKFYVNNNVPDLCCGNLLSPARYSDIEKSSPDLAKELHSFFDDLYSDLLVSALVKRTYGCRRDHYKAFMGAQSVKTCPACGMRDLLTEDNTPVGAYDHFLPKGIYPFNSINFKQLVPICDICNGKYKTTKDPLYRDSASRKAFHPFVAPTVAIGIQVGLPGPLIDEAKAEEIELKFTSGNQQDEVDTWAWLYGIEEQYRSFANENGKHWAKQIINFSNRPGQKSTRECYEDHIATYKDQPLRDQHFLRVPFLEECERVGVFN